MSELTRLTGVGPKRQKALEASGITTLRDLVTRIPRRYVDRTRITPVASLACFHKIGIVIVGYKMGDLNPCTDRSAQRNGSL
jgi:RecG-like helicase